MNIKQFIILFAVLCLVPKILTAEPQGSLVAQWNNVILLAAYQSGFNSLILARMIAIVHNAMYNALTVYDPKAVSDPPTGIPRRPKSEWTTANKQNAISYAAYYSLKGLLPDQVPIFDQFMQALGLDIQTINTNTKSAAGIGTVAAQKILKFRENDGSNQLGNLNPSGAPYSEPILKPGYKPYKYINTVDKLNNVNYWQPQRNPDGSAQTYVIPHWGFVKPFAMTSGSQFRPKKGPLRLDTDRAGFMAQAQQIHDIVNNLTPKQRLIALFWDGQVEIGVSPWHIMAAEIAVRDKYCLDEEVKLFFATSNALFDAMIASWDAKRVYNSVRPITAIHKFIDPDWQTVPEIPTPPHPDFTSGHAVLAACAAELFRGYTGSDYYGGSYSDEGTGVTLAWKTFSDTVVEAGFARMYAGIHYEIAVEVGQEQGRKVGQTAWKKVKRLLGR